MKPRTGLAAAAALFALTLGGYAAAGPLEDGQAAFLKGDYATALKLFKPLADQGNAIAEFKLGFMYFGGAGVPEDHVQGAAWMHKAAAQGNAAAKAWLLLVCMGPMAGPEDNCDQAFAEIRTAAEHGDPKAQAQFGGMYLLGKGVPKDGAQGAAWVRKAADQGYVAAQLQLGLIYSSSFMGVPEDQAQSLAWYQKAADQGSAAADLALGMHYEMGVGGAPKDEAQAAAWYRKGAEKGEFMSETSLAKMYDEGRGVARDPAQTLYWYRKLAEQGDANAMAKVGSAYALGKGAPQDYVQAYVWLHVAVAEAADSKLGGGDDNTLARDSVAAHLTPAQLADAKRQSAALKAKLDAASTPSDPNSLM